jgi:hypothetical protein
MKKNIKNIQENLSKNYLLTFPEIKKLEEKRADNAELGEYFDNTSISVYFAVPDEEINSLMGLKISYPFRIQLTEENKYDITHDDLSSCSIVIYKRYNPINFEQDDIYSDSIVEGKFKDFINKSLPIIDEYFDKINEQSFFDFKVRKNKVILDKNLIKYVKKRICSYLNNTVDLLDKGDDDSLYDIYKGSDLEMDRIEALSFAIKRCEKKYEYKQLSIDLNNELNSNKIQNPNKRVKI